MLTGALVGSIIGGLTPFGLCIPCGPFGGAFLGGLVGGLEALATPFISGLSVLATLCGALALPCSILAIPCGDAIEGMFIGLGDIISGCCGTLAI